MKYPIAKIYLGLIIAFFFNGSVYAQQIDPALASAVFGGSVMETNVLKSLSKAQDKIAVHQTSISANMMIVREYEKKTHDYLQNASGAIKNAIEIKQAAEITAQIIKAFDSCAEAARNNPEGVIMSAIVSKHCAKSARDLYGVYSYIVSLSLSSQVLLNAVERNQIMWTVLYKLRRIKSDVLLLEFQIENYTLADLPSILFPLEHFYLVDGKRIADGIIKDFSKF